MRVLLASATAAALLACSPPAPPSTDDASSPQPQVVACNSVTPNSGRQVSVQDETAAAAAAADLRGGSIAPGVYDLTSATRVGAATGWQGGRAVALEIAENQAGVVTLNWAGAESGGETDRWTATLTETPQTRLTYTCGRIGEVEADFTAQGDALQLRLPDGANGSLMLIFERRV